MHIHANKVRLPTNTEPTYSLKRVPTQGTACKTKENNKTKTRKGKIKIHKLVAINTKLLYGIYKKTKQGISKLL